MRKLKITGCSDGHMWYAGLIGQVVPLLREESGDYFAREPAGYVNVVRKADARPVWVDLEGNEFGDGDVTSCACGAVRVVLSSGVSRSVPVETVRPWEYHAPDVCKYLPAHKSEKVKKAECTNVPDELKILIRESVRLSFAVLLEDICSKLSTADALLSKGTNG